jgi:hypothetical protein
MTRPAIAVNAASARIPLDGAGALPRRDDIDPLLAFLVMP